MIQIGVHVHLDNTIVNGSLDFLSNGRRGIRGSRHKGWILTLIFSVSFTHEGSDRMRCVSMN